MEHFFIEASEYTALVYFKMSSFQKNLLLPRLFWVLF